MGVAAGDGDILQLGSGIARVGPEGEGLCSAAVGKEDTGLAVTCLRAGFEEGFERARHPGARGRGQGWGRKDRGDGGEGEAEGKD